MAIVCLPLSNFVVPAIALAMVSHSEFRKLLRNLMAFKAPKVSWIRKPSY